MKEHRQSPARKGRPRSKRPEVRGREAVRAAVIAAARELFAEKGYAAVSLRAIADRAAVNHGLIHRHFGAKAEVLRAVLQGMFEDVATLARTSFSPDEPDFLRRLYPVVAERKHDWRILMRAVLDGFDFRDAGFEFPITRAVVAHVAAMRGASDDETRVKAGAIIAGGLGWLLLESYLAPILDLQDVDRDALRDRIAALYQQLV